MASDQGKRKKMFIDLGQPCAYVVHPSNMYNMYNRPT